jgi:putative redox protein
MTTQSFDFVSPAGYRLSGRLETPAGEIRGWALFAHCFTCGKDNLAAVRIARTLAQNGIGALRFDFAGLGGSGGDFSETSFAADTRDLIAAGEAMAQAGMPPSLLIGHSLGGAAALAAAASLATVRAVATIAAPFDPAHVLHQIDPALLPAIAEHGKAEVTLAGRPFVIGRGFVDDLRGRDPAATIATLGRPLLILHAPHDAVVGIDNATRIFMAAHHPRSFVSLDDADHLLRRPADAAYAASVIASWAARYLDPVTQTRALGQKGDVVAVETGLGRYQVTLQAGGIRFLADEPESAGGLGSGPTPYDLLASALAACTTMTLRMYADRKGWPVAHIRTAVGHGKEAGTTPADLFTRRVAFDGPLDDTQRGQLFAIADRCPVHRTLERGARVVTEAGEPPAAAGPVDDHARQMESTVEAG